MNYKNIFKDSIENYYQNLQSFNATNTFKILLYHGVTNVKSRGIENYAAKHIYQDKFYEQIKFIKKNLNVLSVNELSELISKRKKIKKNSVLITFDDGYENNFTIAAPILEEFNIPATFYVSSGLINSSKMFWTDLLEDCINRTKKSKILIKFGKKKVELKLKNPSEKVASLEFIKKFCKTSKKLEKDNIIDYVISTTGVDPSENASMNYQKLSWNQIKIMDSNKLFTIGGHSTYHDILSLQTLKMAEKDINLSLDLLEYNLEHEVLDYSYPEGQSNHFNNKIITLLKKRRIHLCPSAINGVNKIGDDPFKLKRIMVGFWNLPFPFFDKNLKS